MSPEEIIEAYNVVANDVSNYTAQEAAKIGNSQASLGLMAERVARPSGTTSGLANYTYDRTLRPTIDSLTTSLVTTGKAQGLENKLKADLRAAKNKYEDAKNAYTVAASTPKNNNVTNYNEKTKASTDVHSTTPDGMTSKTFTYNDGKNSWTGIVYYNADGSIAGASTPYMDYTGDGAINFYNSNSQYISGWGAGGSAYSEGSSQAIKPATTPDNLPSVDGMPAVVDMDGMKVYLVTPDQGEPYYIDSMNGWKFSVSDVMKWF